MVMDEFWYEAYQQYLQGKRIVVSGYCYRDGAWKFQLNDGSLLVTNNLWYNGKIPEKWRDKMPDNAVLIM